MLTKQEREEIAERVKNYTMSAGYKFNYIPLQDCEKEFNEAIKHYKKLAWEEE